MTRSPKNSRPEPVTLAPTRPAVGVDLVSYGHGCPTDEEIRRLLPRTRELLRKTRRAGRHGHARLTGAELFNHIVVAAVLGLRGEWAGLEAAQRRVKIPNAAWLAACEALDSYRNCR